MPKMVCAHWMGQARLTWKAYKPKLKPLLRSLVGDSLTLIGMSCMAYPVVTMRIQKFRRRQRIVMRSLPFEGWLAHYL